MGNKASTPKPTTPAPSCKDKPCCKKAHQPEAKPTSCEKPCSTPCDKPSCENPCSTPCEKPSCEKPCTPCEKPTPCSQPCATPCSQPCATPCSNANTETSASAASIGTIEGVLPPSTFSMAGKKLKLNTAAEMDEHLTELAGLKNVQTVLLNGNTFGVEASQALAQALMHHHQIRTLDMSDCFTGRMKDEVHISIETVGAVLKGSKRLESIDFSDNALGPIGAKALVPLISETRNLRSIRINNNGLGPEGGKIIAAALEAAKQAEASNLRSIIIGRNRLENGSAPYLGKALALHGLVEQVCLPQNGIRPEGIVALMSGLAACRELRHLDLQDNTFTRPGAMALAEAIPNWKHLTHLNIGDCLVGAEGCLTILKALVDSGISQSLTHLNLQYGEMNEEGAKYLADNLDRFPALQFLQLNGNAFDPECPAGLAIRRQLGERIDDWSDMEIDSDEEEEEEEESESEDDARQVGTVPEELKAPVPEPLSSTPVASTTSPQPSISLADEELSTAIEAVELRPEDLSKKLKDLEL